MSRIDEALKRAASADKADVVESPRRWPATAASLEHYPREEAQRRRLGADDAGAPSTVVSTHVVGPSNFVVTPRATRHSIVPGLDPALAGKLITSKDVPPVTIEQYLRLAAAFDAAQAERPLFKKVMVSSALPGDGKTLTVTNLALTLSERYQRRVLLIDTDLRRPRIHHMFRLPNTTGLADLIRSPRVQPTVFEISPYLAVMPAGGPEANPMAGLASGRLEKLLDDAVARFDWVLLDCPPILLSDSQLLSRLVDGALLVIGAGSTPYALVQRAVAEIGAERIIGTVLNRVEDATMHLANYYGRYYGVSADGEVRGAARNDPPAHG